MKKQTIQTESLTEVLHELDRVSLSEERAQKELNLLFESLKILTDFSNKETLIADLLGLFRKTLPFDQAFIIAAAPENPEVMNVIFSTTSQFEGGTFIRHDLFKRVLRGASVACFNIDEVEEWKNLPNSFKQGARSALHLSLRNEKRPAILVCTHSDLGFFSRREFTISEKFAILLSQGLANREYEAIVAKQQLQIFHSSKMAALGEMAGGIAHEVNNPLGIIKLSAEQLQETIEEGKFSPEDISLFTSTITRTVKRIAKIITALRSFSRDGSHDPFELVPVSTLLDNVLVLCREGLTNQKVQIFIDVPDPLTSIECCPIQLEQVFLNLISNSRDAIQNLDEKWIRISVETLVDEVLIRFTDSGSGIPADLRNKIFQPFFSTKEIGKGTGLGLSISKGLVEYHRGTLEIDSENPNTSFKIRLPKQSVQ